MSPSRALLGAVLCVAASCRVEPTPIQLQGSTADIAGLAGEWQGAYSSADNWRGGSIWFKVLPGTDSAYGDVLMSPSNRAPFIAVDAATRAHQLHASSPEHLRITFVRVLDGIVEGSLEPYTALDCRCTVTTVFRGVKRGTEIRGEYETRRESGLTHRGGWRVERTNASIAALSR